MTFVLTVMKLNIGGSSVTKIVNVEARQIDPTSLINENGEGKYLFKTDNDSVINKLLNDHEHVTFASIPSGVNTLTPVTLAFDAASEELSARAVPAADWKVRTRPALMRATSTLNLFNC